METKTIIVTGLSNQEFFARHAQAGCIGLCGGATRVDSVIRRAQRHLDDAGRWSNWSHAFFLQGQRADGHQWVVESDLQFHRKNIQLGAQENRVEKYYDEKMYPTLAILDFGLNARQIAALQCAALEMIARREKYSLRELVGTLLVLRKPELRAQENVLARERSVYCSALVKSVFSQAGIDLVPGVADKNTTPEDLARSPLPHTKYLLQREMPGQKVAALGKKIRAQLVKLKR